MPSTLSVVTHYNHLRIFKKHNDAVLVGVVPEISAATDDILYYKESPHDQGELNAEAIAAIQHCLAYVTQLPMTTPLALANNSLSLTSVLVQSAVATMDNSTKVKIF